MEVIQTLHMNGGNGNSSYANNSTVQQKALLQTCPITKEAIEDLYSRIVPKIISIADLGCSSGPNTLFVTSEIIKSVNKKRTSLGHKKSPEFQIYLSDLPTNDFNTIFKSQPKFQEKLRKEIGSGIGPCFLAGVPGSFYGRLFPSKSLHFVHSSYSLMWLSQVPEGIEENKGNTAVLSTSPPSVLKAYLKQFQTDFSSFLKCRAEELVGGGAMVLTILGRQSDDPRSKDCTLMEDCISKVLNDMVSEGLIEKEKLYAFNFPKYMPSPAELKDLVEEEGSFTISRVELCKVHFNPYDSEECETDEELKDAGKNAAMIMRAVNESLLSTHFGEELMDQVFSKLAVVLNGVMATDRDTSHISVTVALKKKD